MTDCGNDRSSGDNLPIRALWTSGSCKADILVSGVKIINGNYIVGNASSACYLSFFRPLGTTEISLA